MQKLVPNLHPGNFNLQPFSVKNANLANLENMLGVQIQHQLAIFVLQGHMKTDTRPHGVNLAQKESLAMYQELLTAISAPWVLTILFTRTHIA